MADRQRFPITFLSGGDGGCSTSISGTNSDQLSQLTDEDTRGQQQTQLCHLTPQFCDHWTICGGQTLSSPD